VTFSPTSQYRVVQGWVVSTLVHGLALTVVLGFMAQGKPAIPKDVFTWDVALVELKTIQDTRHADITPDQEPAQATPRPIPPTPPQPKMAMQKVQTHEVTPVVRREISQVIETSEPMQQMVAVQTRTEEVMPVREQQLEDVQQTHQPMVESLAPLVQHEAVTADCGHPIAGDRCGNRRAAHGVCGYEICAASGRGNPSNSRSQSR